MAKGKHAAQAARAKATELEKQVLDLKARVRELENEIASEERRHRAQINEYIGLTTRQIDERAAEKALEWRDAERRAREQVEAELQAVRDRVIDWTVGTDFSREKITSLPLALGLSYEECFGRFDDQVGGRHYRRWKERYMQKNPLTTDEANGILKEIMQ